MLKKTFVIFIFTLFMNNLSAQESTLLGDFDEVTGYGGPIVKYAPSKFGREEMFFVGGKGGAIFGHFLFIGGAGYGLASDVTALYNNERYYMQMGYGGVHLDFIFMSDSIIHFVIGSTIGAGGAVLSRSSLYGPEENVDNTVLRDSFFIVEPNVELELNVYKSFRIAAAVSYLHTIGFELGDLTSTQIKGVNFYIMLKFGSF